MNLGNKFTQKDNFFLLVCFSSVRPVAPDSVSSVPHAWNATVQWKWKYDSYSSLALVCQVELTCQESKTNVSCLCARLCMGVTTSFACICLHCMLQCAELSVSFVEILKRFGLIAYVLAMSLLFFHDTSITTCQ